MIYESDEFWESVEERAAIMQFDAGLSAKEAQKAAFADVCNFCIDAHLETAN